MEAFRGSVFYVIFCPTTSPSANAEGSMRPWSKQRLQWRLPGELRGVIASFASKDVQ